MADLQTVAIPVDSIKIRWEEDYVSVGVNRQNSVLAPGVYHGCICYPTSTPSKSFRLAPNPTGTGPHSDSCFVYRDNAGHYGMVFQSASEFVFDMTAQFSGGGGTIPSLVVWYVWADIAYSIGSTTDGDFHVTTTAPPAGAVVLARITMQAGDTVINVSNIAYANMTKPIPTKRDGGAHVAGDETYGFLSGEESWNVPSNDQKKAMNAADAPTGANRFITDSDLSDQFNAELAPIEDHVFVEHTVVTVTVLAGQNYVDFDQAIYGSVYVGNTTNIAALKYFDVRNTGGTSPLIDSEYQSSRIRIDEIRKYGTSTPINPATEADSAGFYTGGFRLKLTVSGGGVIPNIAFFPTSDTTIDVWYPKKAEFSNLRQVPQTAFVNSNVHRDVHSDLVYTRDLNNNIPCTEIARNANLSLHLARLYRRTSGTIRLDDYDYRVSQKDLLDSFSFFKSSSGFASSVPTYPRKMCFAFNNVGLIGGEYSGVKYILYTVNSSSREQIYRAEINPGGKYITSSADFIDPVDDVWDSGGHSVASESDWKICDMASDGRYVYALLRAVDTSGYTVLVLNCFDILTKTRRTGWPAGGRTIHSGSAIANYDNAVNNAAHVIVANDTYLAVNEYWEELGANPTKGIALYRRDTGAFYQRGQGTGSSFTADCYAAGPMCSDGTNIYFTVRLLVQNYSFGISQCIASNPSSFQSNAAEKTFDFYSWLPATSPLQSSNPRSLVFDGKYVWLTTRFGVGGMPKTWVTASGDVENIYFDPTNKYIFGPMIFDGTHLWFGMTDVTYSASHLYCEKTYHMCKFNPKSIRYMADSSGYFGDLEDLIGNDKYAFETSKVNGTLIDWYDEYPFGDPVFDGETLWWTSSWWNPTTGVMPTRGTYLNYIYNINGL